jgi:hypothetical protein
VSSDDYKVNEEKLSESQEAWVHIKISPGGESSTFVGFGELDAILTWPNSD